MNEARIIINENTELAVQNAQSVPEQTGNCLSSTQSMSSGGWADTDSVCMCLLYEAYVAVPPNSHYVSLCIRGAMLSVGNTEDVLVWVLKKMCFCQSVQLQRVMCTRRLSWLKISPGGMERHYLISNYCFVNLDGSGPPPLFCTGKPLNGWRGRTMKVLSDYSPDRLRDKCGEERHVGKRDTRNRTRGL